MMKLYKVTEVNIDGNGTNVDEYISTTKKMDPSHLTAFGEILNMLKNDPEWEDSDTYSYIEEACRIFNEKHPDYNLKMDSSPFEDVIEF